MTTRRTFVQGAVAATALGAFGRSAVAQQDYPSRPITVVVPFTAGGIADAGGRVVGKALSGILGQPVIVENKAGAGGIVGGEFVANAKPDGYTLLIASNGVAVTFPFLFKKLSFDPQKNFTPVHGISISPLMVAVP